MCTLKNKSFPYRDMLWKGKWGCHTFHLSIKDISNFVAYWKKKAHDNGFCASLGHFVCRLLVNFFCYTLNPSPSACHCSHVIKTDL